MSQTSEEEEVRDPPLEGQRRQEVVVNDDEEGHVDQIATDDGRTVATTADPELEASDQTLNIETEEAAPPTAVKIGDNKVEVAGGEKGDAALDEKQATLSVNETNGDVIVNGKGKSVTTDDGETVGGAENKPAEETEGVKNKEVVRPGPPAEDVVVRVEVLENSKNSQLTAAGAPPPPKMTKTAGGGGGKKKAAAAKSRGKESGGAAKDPARQQVEMAAASLQAIMTREASKMEKTLSVPAAAKHSSKKRVKKSLYMSYSPDARYVERKLVCEVVRQLKENNLAEDIWFDKDERNVDSPSWFSQRMEAVERCVCCVCFLSASYFECPVSIYELRCLVERIKQSAMGATAPGRAAATTGAGAESISPKVFLVLYDKVDIPKQYTSSRGGIFAHTVDLTEPPVSRVSVAEKASVVVGGLVERLERYASIRAPFVHPKVGGDRAEGGAQRPSHLYHQRKLCRWSCGDLEQWLGDLGVREFYRQCLAESMVDGFLLMAVTDQDLQLQLGVDSRVVRRKILQQCLATLSREKEQLESWHLRARMQRSRPDTVYLVYDPSDVRLAQNLKQDLKRKNMQVITHEHLGQSRDEFLQINGPHIATAKHVVVVLTEAAVASPFVFHEVMFADWLGKTLVSAMFKNTWDKLRPALRAVLGECLAVDFESKMYVDSLDILEHQVKPLRKVPGVVLEQSYLNRMSEGLRPLQELVASTGWAKPEEKAPVFISFQWDMQHKVEEIKRILEANGLHCWSDATPTVTQTPGGAVPRGHSSSSARSSGSEPTDSIQNQIQKSMKAASVVVCCVTPRYLQSDNCVKDLALAESLHKPVVALLLRFVAWPPDGPQPVKKMLARMQQVVDLSNDKLFKLNFHLVIEKVRKNLAKQSVSR